MFGIVGYGRTIAPLALVLSAAAGAAEPAEPLTVTRLPDAEKELLVSAASDNIGAPENDTGAFTRAISEAVRTQQQSTQANCESVRIAKSPIAIRWAWEARCRYNRY